MKRRSDEEISAPLYEYDAAIRAQYGFFAGVDEAGRGPLCGPVVVAGEASVRHQRLQETDREKTGSPL